MKNTNRQASLKIIYLVFTTIFLPTTTSFSSKNIDLPTKAYAAGMPAKEKQNDSKLLMNLKEKHNKLERQITIKKNILSVLEKKYKNSIKAFNKLAKDEERKKKNLEIEKRKIQSLSHWLEHWGNGTDLKKRRHSLDRRSAAVFATKEELVLQLRNTQNNMNALHEEYKALLMEITQMRHAAEDMKIKLQMRKNTISSLKDQRTLVARQIKRLNRT